MKRDWSWSEVKTDAHAVLLRAAELIETFGWCQKILAKGENGELFSVLSPTAAKFSLVGAIYRAGAEKHNLQCLDQTMNDAARICVRRVLDRERQPIEYTAYPRIKDTIDGWNNVEGRTKEEVIAVLRDAAALIAP